MFKEPTKFLGILKWTLSKNIYTLAAGAARIEALKKMKARGLRLRIVF
jgi:hypothetical protein